MDRSAHVGTAAPGRSAGPGPAARISCGDSRPRPSSRPTPGRTTPRIAKSVFPALALLSCLTTQLFASDCLPIAAAGQHVGETRCVTGKVLRVKAGIKGVHYLDFCEAQSACPFSVVVFASDLKDVGDVRRLAGRTIEVSGPVKLYLGRAEIILRRINQISGGAALIPPLPRQYDVENRGHYSAGHFHSRKLKRPKPVPNAPATYGNEAETASEDPH